MHLLINVRIGIVAIVVVVVAVMYAMGLRVAWRHRFHVQGFSGFAALG